MEVGIILEARKALLFHEKEPWVKTEGRGEFDVPMWCFNGAKTFELVG